MQNTMKAHAYMMRKNTNNVSILDLSTSWDGLDDVTIVIVANMRKIEIIVRLNLMCRLDTTKLNISLTTFFGKCMLKKSNNRNFTRYRTAKEASAVSTRM
jgi:hypothetical protein